MLPVISAAPLIISCALIRPPVHSVLASIARPGHRAPACRSRRHIAAGSLSSFERATVHATGAVCRRRVTSLSSRRYSSAAGRSVAQAAALSRRPLRALDRPSRCLTRPAALQQHHVGRSHRRPQTLYACQVEARSWPPTLPSRGEGPACRRRARPLDALESLYAARKARHGESTTRSRTPQLRAFMTIARCDAHRPAGLICYAACAANAEFSDVRAACPRLVSTLPRLL